MLKLTRSHGRRLPIALCAALVALALIVLSLVRSSAASAATPVGLGTASTFAVLGGESVTNTGPTTISGNLGVNPGSSVTGSPLVINGSIYASDDAGVSLQAKNDAKTAYNDAAGRQNPMQAPTQLGTEVLAPGVYQGNTLALDGTLVLDGQNDPAAVFVFQSAIGLITAPNSVVTLVRGANACNVFWQLTESAVLGTNSVFAGTILASTSITAAFGTDVEGRLLADTGSVTLDTATVVLPRCGGVDTTTTVTAAGPTTTETTTVAGPTTTETTTVAGPTTTVTTGPVVTETVTEAGATATVTEAGTTATVTVTGPTTTVTGPTTTVTGPTTTETTTVAGPTTTLTTGPVTTETVTGPTTTITAPGTSTTVTAPGSTTTVAAAPAGTVTVTAGAGTEAAEGAGQLTETVTATVILSVQANGETVALQTVAPSSNATAGSGLVFTGPGAGSGPGGLAFTGSKATTMLGIGLALVALGGLTLLLVRRSPIRSRQH